MPASFWRFVLVQQEVFELAETALESRHSLAPLMHGLTLKSEGFTTWPIGFIFDPLSQNSSMFPRARARA